MGSRIFLLAAFAGALLGGTAKAQPDELKAQISKQLELLKSGTMLERLHAVQFLQDLGPEAKGAIPELRKALKEDMNAGVRFVAALALGSVCRGSNNPEAVADLAQALKDSDAKVRTYAAMALGQLGEWAKEAVPALTAALKDLEVRVEVAEALLWIEPDNATAATALVEVLARSGSNGHHAMTVLQMHGAKSKAAVPLLVQALGHREKEVRFMAAQALVYVDPAQKAAVPVLVAVLQDRDLLSRWQNTARLAKDALLVLRDSRTLTSTLSRSASTVRYQAVRIALRRGMAADALGRMGLAAQEAMPALAEASKDPSPIVRWSASKALNEIQGAPHAPLSPLPARAPEKEE